MFLFSSELFVSEHLLTSNKAALDLEFPAALSSRLSVTAERGGHRSRQRPQGHRGGAGLYAAWCQHQAEASPMGRGGRRAVEKAWEEVAEGWCGTWQGHRLAQGPGKALTSSPREHWSW